MFFIRQGEVEVHIRGKGVVAVKHAGDFFGEVALFLPESFRIRTATCRARTLCELMILDKSDADLVKSNFPELAAAMVRGAAMNSDISVLLSLCTVHSTFISSHARMILTYVLHRYPY